MTSLAQRRVLLVGAGGIAHPAAWALVRAGVGEITIVDDDEVDVSNLHRQILFEEADVGAPKLEAIAAALGRAGASRITPVHGRLDPDTALDLVARADVVLDAVDNFASRFLAADAAHLARVPVVHAAAVRWFGTVFASGPAGRPCYRCVFEDLPSGDAPDCASAGVVGPVCGVAGAIGADMVLAVLSGAPVFGTLVRYDGRRDSLRAHVVAPRADCALCGAEPRIADVDAARYVSAECSL